MRVIIATLALVSGIASSIINPPEPALHIAQMARDVTDAVRKQRTERRARPRRNVRSSDETRR